MPIPLGQETVLKLTGLGIAPYSARGLRQTLEPIEAAAHMRRTIGGVLVDLSLPQFRKYRSTITGEDQREPVVGGCWPGLVLTVDCIVHIALGERTSARTVVPGSQHVDGGVTYFRPRLTMMVTGWNLETDEYGAQVGWQLDLEEV